MVVRILLLMTLIFYKFKASVNRVSILIPVVVINFGSSWRLVDLRWSRIGLILAIFTLGLLPLVVPSSKDFKSRALLAITYLLTTIILISFLVTSILIFYVLFELIALPIVLILIGWGGQPERLSAAVYLLLYTILRSIPFLAIIIYLAEDLYFYLSLLIVLPFLIKTPAYLFHVWLPKAHVEAPVFGSILLAAILLKVGVYGCFRVACYISPASYELVGTIVLIGGAICCLFIVNQIDLKALIAYSRIVHIRALVGPTLAWGRVGVIGALIMSLAHGITRSGLFYIVTLQYSRVGTRSLFLSKGLLTVTPILALLWVLLILTNLRAPPSLNLIRELLLFSYWGGFSIWAILPIFLIVLMALAYSLILFFSYRHGQPFKGLSTSFGRVLEYCISLTHVYWLAVGLLIIGTGLC